MINLDWDDSLSVGVPRIDDQYKEFLHILRDLVDAVEGNGKSGEIGDVISFLEGYVVFHFGAEERFMMKYHYPGVKQHIDQHRVFNDNLAKLKAHYDEKGASPELANILKDNLCNWLLVHIRDVDGQMGRYLKEHM